MLWTLVAVLVGVALSLLQVLKTVVNKVKAIYFAYPSDAVIDQVIPQEIMEHVMTFLDPRAMMECRVVSKYWRYHAMKQRVENAVNEQARRRYASKSDYIVSDVCVRLREVYNELRVEMGMRDITDKVIERLMNSPITQSSLFFRASALASKHGADLIVADVEIRDHILGHDSWRDPLRYKKYFMLTSAIKGPNPWSFVTSRFQFRTEPMFDLKAVDWHETERHQTIDILFEVTFMPIISKDQVKLYLYHPHAGANHFYFVPLNEKVFHVLLFLFTPLIVHDVLHSKYLPTIKSWFGSVMFMASFFTQFMLLVFLNRQNIVFKLVLVLYLIGYLLLTYISYPVSMTVFAGLGIQALMIVYTVFGKDYFYPYRAQPMSKKKWQVLITGLSVIFMMIDWKLVVDSTRDLSIFRTLFDNTFYYCILLMHGVIDNFLDKIHDNGFAWEHLVKWDTFTVQLLSRCYALVVLMTLIAPTWHGNHL